MKKLFLIPIMIVLAVILLAAGYAEAKPVVLKAVTFLPTRAFPVICMTKVVKKVAATAKGELVVKLLGGPEVIPPPAQVDAVRKNIVQIALVPMEGYDGLVPIGHAATLSELTPAEERASGAYAYMNELHKQAGLFYLERGNAFRRPVTFNLHTNVRTEKPEDLKGQKLASSTSILDATLQSFGVSTVIVPNAEFYTSVERGVADGYVIPITNSVRMQLYEVTKYVIQPGILRGGLAFIVNLGAWNGLPPNLQKILMDAAIDATNEYMNEVEGAMNKMFKKGEDGGMKIITWSPSDAERFRKKLYEIGWEDYTKKHPNISAKLRPMLSK
ncbi:TRAP transporter substrate-binding protein DctP [Thermodesulfobacteriota bacterium]